MPCNVFKAWDKATSSFDPTWINTQHDKTVTPKWHIRHIQIINLHHVQHIYICANIQCQQMESFVSSLFLANTLCRWAQLAFFIETEVQVPLGPSTCHIRLLFGPAARWAWSCDKTGVEEICVTPILVNVNPGNLVLHRHNLDRILKDVIF